ncbi:MAG TPA: GNAT family N-acetyltransferase [Longimicrobiales bacterium]
MIYREAEARDAAALAAFAERVFVSSFEQQVPRAELEPVARQRFTVERQQADIADSASTIYLALDREIAGYAQVVLGTRPKCELDANSPAQLKRIYVDAAWHGHGVAQSLFALVEAQAREQQCDVLWLAVWDRNARGIAFYEKLGFRVIGTTMIAVGNLSLLHNYMSLPLS